MSYKAQRRILLFCFLFFPMLLMIMFLIIPTARMIFYSFTNWDGVLPTFHFVSLLNYKNALTTPLFWSSLKNNVAYAVTGIFINAIALFFAVLLNGKMKGRNIYKTIIFLPYVLNITAIAYMFNFMYDYSQGPINMLVKFLGFHPIRFFSDPHIAIFTLVSMSNWRWLGYTMVIYFASLQSIDTEIYEASAIDGANKWQAFWQITFPNITRIVELLLFLQLSGSLQAFTETLILTKGAPAQSTYTFMYYIIQTYTQFNNYGYAAAMSVVLVLIIVILAAIQRFVVNRGGAKYD